LYLAKIVILFYRVVSPWLISWVMTHSLKSTGLEEVKGTNVE